MSRRHKNDIIENYKPQRTESHADGSPRVNSDSGSTVKNTIVKGFRFTVSSTTLAGKLAALAKVVSSSLQSISIDIDDEWIKFPRRQIEKVIGKSYLDYFREEANSQYEREEPKRGRNPIRRLINKISDSKVMEIFRNTWDDVKSKCVELYENVTQLSVCFLKSIHRAFAPDDDPYGKISHYHVMLEREIPNFPTRKTLSNYYNWFVNWKPILFNESTKERKERHRHGIWKQLIEWIYYYLLDNYPEYAVQTQRV